MHVDGTPVGDVIDQLSGADLVADATELGAWLAGDHNIVVCDVPNTAAMHAAAAALAGHDVLLVGPAGPLGAAFAATRTVGSTGRAAPIAAPVLVVCGSANPVAREQVRQLQAARPDVEVLATSVPAGVLHARAVVVLAARARQRIEKLEPRTIVVIGGDTAAELLGRATRLVYGFAAVGTPWSFNAGGSGPLVVTKAGGFGAPDALVQLLRGENG